MYLVVEGKLREARISPRNNIAQTRWCRLFERRNFARSSPNFFLNSPFSSFFERLIE